MSLALSAGDVLAGKYRIERVLGRGGMGMVVAAMHLQLDRRVALKFLLPEVARNPELVKRFDREARAASKIQSEHVAKVLDVGTLDDGAPYMVMEYLEGSDLAEIVKTRGALPGQDAIEYVLQACEALAEAHVAGIVHRDLKPANLFLVTLADGSPSIKVLDFGISKIALAGDEGQGMTQTSAMMGSPNYMAPEQLRSARNVDARTDIWALGIILHELLTGEVAFRADTIPELYVCILQNPPTPLRARRPDAPAAMEAIIHRCLEKDPARRFANVAELAAALGDRAPARARPSVQRIARVLGARGPTAFASTGVGPSTPSTPSTPAPPSPAPQGAAPSAAPASSTPAPHEGGGARNPASTPAPAQAHGGGYASQPPAHTPPRAGAYGPGPGYAYPSQHTRPQAPYPYATAYGAPQQRAPQGMSAATVALIVLVTLVVLGGGGCMACFCIGAAGSTKRHSELDHGPVEDGSSALARAVFAVPFQRPAGWTTVSGGAANRRLPPPWSSSQSGVARRARATEPDPRWRLVDGGGSSMGAALRCLAAPAAPASPAHPESAAAQTPDDERRRRPLRRPRAWGPDSRTALRRRSPYPQRSRS